MAKIQSANTGSKNTYSLLEDDVYDARITKVVFTGMHSQKAYKGKAKPDSLQARITFEIIGETITQTNAEGETKEFPATLTENYNVPSGGCAMGKLVALLEAALGVSETFGDTDPYEDLLNKAVGVAVGSYVNKKTGKKHNCVNAISALGKRTKDNLEEAATDLQFFCCYTDSDDMKAGWTNLFPFVRKIISECTEPQNIPALRDQWPDKIDTPDTNGAESSDGAEF